MFDPCGESETELIPRITHINGEPVKEGINTFNGNIGVMAITAVGNYAIEGHDEFDPTERDEYYLTPQDTQFDTKYKSSICLIVHAVYTEEGYVATVSDFYCYKGEWITRKEIDKIFDNQPKYAKLAI